MLAQKKITGGRTGVTVKLPGYMWNDLSLAAHLCGMSRNALIELALTITIDRFKSVEK